MFSDKNFLVQHAYNNVWCAPGLDRQHILNPSRITPTRGAIWTIEIDRGIYNLPTRGDLYDVFVFGDILPQQLGMMTQPEIWINGKTHCETNNLLIDLYNKNGIHYPVCQSWFLVTRNGNLVVALRRFNELTKYNKESLFVRWRSANYYHGSTSVPPSNIKIGYLRYSGNNPLYLEFRENFLAARAIGYGCVFAYHNGKKVRDYSVANLRQDDHLEWVWMGDVKETLQIKYQDLLSFESTMDTARKFLIPRPGLGETIDFVDDTDFFILNYTKPAEYSGIYFHQNRADSVRMVTHRDYSLKSSYVDSAIVDMGWRTTDDIRIEVIVRQSGYDRALVNDSHRIKELFKLDEDDRLNAMIGSDSGVDVWKADSLESSAYLQLMKSNWPGITPAMVIDAYGYHAVSRLTGLVPFKVEPGVRFVDLMYGQYTDATVYEYDINGRLIGWYFHETGIQYVVRNPTTRYIEVYAGKGGVGLSTVYNSHQQTRKVVLDSKRNYRFYLGQNGGLGIGDLSLVSDWQDITGDTQYYQVNSNNEVEWLISGNEHVTAIRNDLDFLSKDIEIDSWDGVIMFTIGSEEVYPGRAPTYGIMDIPPGEYDIMLNGNDLVEGVDYYSDWPEFCIVTKKHRNTESNVNRVTIRARGFCRPDFTFDQPGDRGVVIHNQISRNGRYNVRDDLVTRVSIGGALFTIDEIGFAEDGTLLENVPNGTPYRITHPYIPMLDLVPGDTYAYREISLNDDRQIEGYMDLHKPEPVVMLPNPIPDRYKLVSPFSSKILEDIVAGIVGMDEFMGNITEQQIRNRFDGYSYLLKYDPVVLNNRTDLYTFLPHQRDTVELDIYQFRVMKMVIKTFLNDKIELERYVTVVARENINV